MHSKYEVSISYVSKVIASVKLARDNQTDKQRDRQTDRQTGQYDWILGNKMHQTGIRPIIKNFWKFKYMYNTMNALNF